MLTHSKLKELVYYDPLTGVFTRLKATHGKHEVGEVVGYLTGPGYLGCNIGGAFYYMHRLAVFYETATWPDVVDHLNGVKIDNRISNLRSGSQSDNMCNVAKRTNNTSGLTGVSWDRQAEKWMVKLKGKTLGVFKDFEEAKSVRESAVKQNPQFTSRHGSL